MSQLPARGAVAGVKADLQRAKQAEAKGEKYSQVGVGAAWSHNFLNQKPWHPMNYRNQVRKFEAEQKAVQEQKTREAAQAEFQAEQEKADALAMLPGDEGAKQRSRAALSFMYTKPPGLEAALQRDRELAAKKEREAAEAAAAAAAAGAGAGAAADGGGGSQALIPATAGGGQQQSQQQSQAHAERTQAIDRLREDPFAAMLAARVALQQNERFALKNQQYIASGRSPPRGGADPRAANQQLLVDREEEEEEEVMDGGGAEGRQAAPTPGPGPASASGLQLTADEEALLVGLTDKERRRVMRALEKRQRSAEEQRQLEQARQVLRDAGYDADAVEAGGRSSKRHKSKSHKHRKERSRRRQNSSSSSSSSSEEEHRRRKQRRRERSKER